MALDINDANFKKSVLESDIPVLVDFWAEWCGPCKILSPIIDELSVELKEKVKIVKINIDENPITASELGIRGIPTIMLFKNGKQIGTKVGVSPKSSIIDWINSLI